MGDVLLLSLYFVYSLQLPDHSVRNIGRQMAGFSVEGTSAFTACAALMWWRLTHASTRASLITEVRVLPKQQHEVVVDRPGSFGAVDLFHHPSHPKLYALAPGEIVCLGYFPNLAMPSILTLPLAIASQSKAAMLLALKQSNHGHLTLYTAVVLRTRTVRYI